MDKNNNQEMLMDWENKCMLKQKAKNALESKKITINKLENNNIE